MKLRERTKQLGVQARKPRAARGSPRVPEVRAALRAAGRLSRVWGGHEG